jgi:hypothetical protein
MQSGRCSCLPPFLVVGENRREERLLEVGARWVERADDAVRWTTGLLLVSVTALVAGILAAMKLGDPQLTAKLAGRANSPVIVPSANSRPIIQLSPMPSAGMTPAAVICAAIASSADHPSRSAIGPSTSPGRSQSRSHCVPRS